MEKLADYLDLEPQIVRSIKKNRRRALLEKLIITVSCGLVLALCWFYFQITEDSLKAAGYATAALCVFWGFLAFSLIATASLNSSLSISEYQAPFRLKPFKEALRAVSIGAGLKIPQLRVVDIPTINSVPFVKKGKPAVGITREALLAPFNDHTLEAIMAHQVSHFIVGDALKIGSYWYFHYLPFAVIAFLLTSVLLTFVLGVKELTPGIQVLYILSIVVVIAWGITFGGFILKKLDYISRFDDVLADSIAVHITKNPEALREAIVDLCALADESGTQPKIDDVNNNLFIPPHNPGSESYHDVVRSFIFSQLAMGVGYKEELYLEAEKSEIIRRVRNLETIEIGHELPSEDDIQPM